MKVMVKFKNGIIDVVDEKTAKKLLKNKQATLVKLVKDKLDVVIK